MSWNYRAFRKEDIYEDAYYEIHEVYYNEAGKPGSYTMDPITPVGDNIADLRETLHKMLRDLDKPPLTEADFKGEDE